MNNEQRIDDLEKRVNNIEVISAKLDGKLDSLLKSTDNLRKVVYAFTFILLLAVIYGALGDKGFNQVKNYVDNPIVQTTKE